MRSPKKVVNGEQLKKGKTPTTAQSQPSKHQIELWLAYKNRIETDTKLSKATGAIWSTSGTPKHPSNASVRTKTPRLVLVLDPDGEVLFHEGIPYHKILVAPISIEIEMATQWDFIVERDASPLGYAFMIELWNKTTMLAENLHRGLAILDAQYTDHVKRLAQAETANLIDDSPLDLEMFGNNIGSGVVEAGNEIFHFQHKEIHELEYLIQPVKTLTESLSREEARKQTVFETIKAREQESSDVVPGEVLINQRQKGMERPEVDQFQTWQMNI